MASAASARSPKISKAKNSHLKKWLLPVCGMVCKLRKRRGRAFAGATRGRTVPLLLRLLLSIKLYCPGVGAPGSLPGPFGS